MKTTNLLPVLVLILSILACGFPSSPPVEPAATEAPASPPPVTESAPTTTSFSGTWQGTDPDDGSIITLTLVQNGQNLTGEFKDTFSGSVPPPGYEGPGSGSTFSATSALMTFNLSRSDSAVGPAQYNLELSDGNNTLIFTPVGGKNIVMQRK